MTYLKTALIASVAIAFSSVPAFAGENMHKDHMNAKTYTQVNYDLASNLSAADRLTWETKVKANMSDAKKAKWATLTSTEQDMWMNKKIAKMMTKQMSSPTMIKTTSATSVTDAEAMKINDTIGEVLQADGDADPEADRKLLMSNGDQMTKAKLKMMDSDNIAANNAIVVPTIGSNVLTTVACPVGTTAQPDMTCHVTGNYNPTS